MGATLLELRSQENQKPWGWMKNYKRSFSLLGHPMLWWGWGKPRTLTIKGRDTAHQEMSSLHSIWPSTSWTTVPSPGPWDKFPFPFWDLAVQLLPAQAAAVRSSRWSGFMSNLTLPEPLADQHLCCAAGGLSRSCASGGVRLQTSSLNSPIYSSQRMKPI